MKKIIKITSISLVVLFFSSCFKQADILQPSFFTCDIDGVSWEAENGGSAISDGKVIGFSGQATDGTYINWYLTLEDNAVFEEKEYQVLDDYSPILASYCAGTDGYGNCSDGHGNVVDSDGSVVGFVKITKLSSDFVEGTFEFTLGTVKITNGKFKLYYSEI